MKKGYMFLCCTLLSFIMLSSYSSPVHSQLRIIRTFTNFDAHNLVWDSLAVDNLELEFFGLMETSDILAWYRGPARWGLPPRINSFNAGYVPGLPGGVEVTWLDRISPIPYCEKRHFGLQLCPDLTSDSVSVQAYWTRIRKVVQIPVPWQFWQIMPGVVRDIIRLSDTYPEPVAIDRDYVVLPEPVSLDSLNWDILLPAEVDWIPARQDTPYSVLRPAEYLGLQIDIFPETRAVLVRYNVASIDQPDTPITRFVNEAIIEYQSEPQIVGTLSNFDVHNIYDLPFDNLELDFFGCLKRPDIIDYYDGFNSWGNPPRVRDFPHGFFPGLPGGVEVTWIDKIDPIDSCETRHFGLAVNPLAPPPEFGVQAYWTIVDTVAQIPVPWQFWYVEDDTVIVDEIHLSRTFPDSVILNVDYTIVPEAFLLDSLTYNLTLPPGVTWTTALTNAVCVPGGHVVVKIDPGGTFIYGAVLVRYTVALTSYPGMIITRFVCQAEIFDPKTGIEMGPQQLPGRYWLRQNYPNPFNAETQITFGIPKETSVTLTIYNSLGQQVKTLINEMKKPGLHTVHWDGKNNSGVPVSSGMYFYHLRTKEFNDIKKLLLMK